MEIGTRVLPERRISNSSLDWIRLGPRVFKMMWDRELISASSRSLDLGSAVHCAILEPERFEEDYYVMDGVEHVGGLMGDFIRAVHAAKQHLLEIEDLSEEEYKAIADKIGFKIKLSTILSNYNDPKYDAYKEALQASHGKFVLSQDDLSTINAVTTAVKGHKVANRLLFSNEKSEQELRFESTVHGKYLTIPSVGIIDRIIFDEDNKKITIVDLKTTSNSVYLFSSSYKKYQYDRQMAFYFDMVKELYPDYDVEVYIVAVQTTYATHTTDCAVYQIDEIELDAGRLKYQDLLDKVSWHMAHDIWDYPQEYYESNGLCQISQSP